MLSFKSFSQILEEDYIFNIGVKTAVYFTERDAVRIEYEGGYTAIFANENSALFVSFW